MSIQHEHSLHPVTALEFYCDIKSGSLLVLAGEGALLKVFDALTSTIVSQCEIFSGQGIHGISIREDVSDKNELQVAIWGSTSLVLLRKGAFNQILNGQVKSIVEASITVSDWILDAALSPGSDSICVLITAHNTVLRARLVGVSDVVTIDELHSPSRSILYSAHLVWESEEKVLVAAGTVFGEVIVWQCSIPKDTAQSAGQVLFTFTGHEGSIFGVNISPPIFRADNSHYRLLASCSDDRTIRIWDLSSRSGLDKEYHGANTPRETGFGSNGETVQHKCVAMAMGHASRIWRVKFLVGNSDDTRPPPINVLSFGEDSTSQQWTLDLGQGTLKGASGNNPSGKDLSLQPTNHGIVGNLQNTRVSAFHSGKHIWSAAVQSVELGDYFLATGGADGKISLFKVRINITKVQSKNDLPRIQAPSGPERVSYECSLDELFSTLPIEEFPDSQSSARVLPTEGSALIQRADPNAPKVKKVKKVPKDAFNRYAFVTDDEVLVTTTFGRVLLGSIENSVDWKELSLPGGCSEDLKSYAAVRGFPEINRAFLAGTNGKIFTFHQGSGLVKFGSVNGKVADLFKIIDVDTRRPELLVTTLTGNSITAFAIDETTEKCAASTSYTLPEDFIVTAGGRHGRFLALGSRNGTLAIYNTNTQSQIPCTWKSQSPVSKDALTTLVPLRKSSNGSDDIIYFLTTSRKGQYCILRWKFELGGDQVIMGSTVETVHSGTPPFGPLIENAWFSDEELCLYGFKGKNFVVWNETKQCEILSVECGGAHRSYAYSSVGSKGHFIYTKASKLYLHTHLKFSHQIVKKGGHGREIKACAVSKDRSLLATGSEDTAIRIWAYKTGVSPLENEFQCLVITQKHTAGIQHLQWHGTEYLFSSGGNEEFYIWAIEQIPDFGIGVVCEATCPDQTEERDLRIMSFDVTALPSSSERKLLITLAYSDSTLRTYCYSKTSGFKLLATGRYTSSCLLHVRHIKVSEAEVHLLTAATDGDLTVWKTNFSTSSTSDSSTISTIQHLNMLSTKKLHQSSIKSLDFIAKSDQTIIATGGDDNAIGISIYTDLTKLPTSSILRAAHSAAVTGICFVHDASELSSCIRVVSSSNDQRVKQWDIESRDDGSVGIKKNGDEFTCIADVGDVASLRDVSQENSGGGKVLVVGNGMEIWSVGGK